MHSSKNACVLAIASLIFVLTFGSSHAQSADSARVFMVGHSLVNFDMPTMLAGLADDAGKTHQRGEQIGIGAPLIHNWKSSETAQGLDARVELPTGEWNTLVMTEAIPLINHLTWKDTYTYAGNFHQLALDGNNTTRSYIYETWHCINSGTPTGCEWDDNEHIPWRQRLDDDLALWEGIVDHLNANHSGPEVRLVPAGQALALLHDRILESQVPGIGPDSPDQRSMGQPLRSTWRSDGRGHANHRLGSGQQLLRPRSPHLCGSIRVSSCL